MESYPMGMEKRKLHILHMQKKKNYNYMYIREFIEFLSYQ